MTMLVLCVVVPARAQHPPAGGPVSEVAAAMNKSLDVAAQALELTGRSLTRWFVLVTVVVALVAVAAVWKLVSYGRELGRLQALLKESDRKFAAMAEELLRVKRRPMEIDSELAGMKAKLDGLAPTLAAAGQVKEISAELVRLGARLARHDAQVGEMLTAQAALTGQVRAAASRVDGVQAILGAERCLREGSALLERGENDRAAAEFTRCLELLATLGDGEADVRRQALARRGQARLAVGGYSDAAADAEAALALSADGSETAGLHIARGLAGLHLNRPDEALANFGRAVAADPAARELLAGSSELRDWLRTHRGRSAQLRRRLAKMIAPSKLRA
jgi:tetratricopeptide (TPR) repeat protein